MWQSASCGRGLRPHPTRDPSEGERRLAAALETAAADVEATYRVPVDVVAVGDADLDARGEALVAAAREAMVNAAKFGAGSPVAVYAEADGGSLQVFVRDRGPGYDPGAVPADRRGLRESVVGRMARNGTRDGDRRAGRRYGGLTVSWRRRRDPAGGGGRRPRLLTAPGCAPSSSRTWTSSATPHRSLRRST